MKSQRFPPLLRLSFPVPGSRSSARAVGRGRGKSQGAAPGPRCWGAAAALPSGPHPGRTGSHGGPNFSARGSRRGRPAAKLPRRLVEIFLNFFFFPGSYFSPPLPGNFRHCPTRHGATSSANKATRGAARGGGGAKETSASPPQATAVTEILSAAPRRCQPAPPRPLAGESGGAGGWA